MAKDLLNYIPKKYRQSVSDFYHDEDGYWLMLRCNGEYVLQDGGYTVHEDTIKDVLKVFRADIQHK